MKTSILKTTILAALIAFASCSKDDDGSTMTGESYDTKVSITDAPIDNASVSAAVVTITDLKVDGISIEGFTTTTVDLLALQNGTKATLGNLGLEAGMISNVSLVLDYEMDQDGNFPGCFVETADGVKHQLIATTNEIKINDQVEILASSANEIVIDFDLRKTIIATAEAGDEFDFVTDAELSSGLRLVNEIEAGTVSGTVNDSENTSEMIIVYAYEAGTYTAAEAEGQGSSGVTFANAVTSAVVNDLSASYELNFLEEGNYEVHFASYSDNDADGQFEFNGMLDVESATNINLSSVNVTSNFNLMLAVTVKGML